MTKRNAKLFYLSALAFLLPIQSFGQELLTLDQLDTVRVFTSIEEATKRPLEVYRLELKKEKLKEIPSEIYQFKNLQYLDLSKNKIDTFPAQLAELTYLQVLNLSRNELNYLTEAIGNLTNLIVLRAGNNYLWEIDKSIGNLKRLEILDLWANRLIILPETLQDLKTLKEIDMRVNPVKREVQEELQEYLPNCVMHFSNDCNCY